MKSKVWAHIRGSQRICAGKYTGGLPSGEPSRGADGVELDVQLSKGWPAGGNP